MKKYYYLIVIVLILGLVLTGCSLLSNISQVPSTEQSSITYLSKSPLPDLVGLWHLYEGTGTIAHDSTVNSNDGTLYNFTSPHGWVSGMFGQALSFDGSDDYVDCNSNVGNFGLSHSFTIEAWINLASDNTNDAVIYGNAWAEPGYHVRVTLANKVRFILITTGSNYKGIDSSVLADGWHHIAAVKDGMDVKVYIDGVEDSQEAIENGTVTTITTTANTKIGLDTASADHYFNGLIDEVRIWNGALTYTEIAYSYSLGDVGIDIKPGSDPNSINLSSKGVVPVAVLTTDDFDAIDVNPDTVSFAGASPIRWVIEDVDGDGDMDLLFHFKTQDLNLDQHSIEATLIGEIYVGIPIEGTDTVNIVT